MINRNPTAVSCALVNKAMRSYELQNPHPTKACVGCRKSITKTGYAKRQWKSEEPKCRECTAESADAAAHNKSPTTKTCAQCKEAREKDQFPKKQWKREDALCRLCFELTIISDEMTRQCNTCKVEQPRTQYSIYQWDKGADALCHGCCESLTKKCLRSVGKTEIKVRADDTTLCSRHDLERCDICMVDHTLPNMFARERAALGRDLTDSEYEAITVEYWADSGIRINPKICILDGQPICSRSGRKLRCPCNEVTYCSKACQKHHWPIHKMTCKAHSKKKKKVKEAPASHSSSQPTHGLTEEELDYIRIEAFMAEVRGGVKHAIEECAWQLGEHPLVIGGGQIVLGSNGEEFVKGDVAKIYREEVGVEYDGSPRFGYKPYVQQKTPFDWIAKAKGGKPRKKKDLEKMIKEFQSM